MHERCLALESPLSVFLESKGNSVGVISDVVTQSKVKKQDETKVGRVLHYYYMLCW